MNVEVFLSSLTWRDVLDVLINTYLLFRIYVLFYGSKLLRALIGIVILVGLQRISAYFGLVMTSFVLQGVVAIALFILIIAFRNEIRAVLQVKRVRDLLWTLRRIRIDRSSQSDIIESVFSLAAERVGAIIVLPGRHTVESFVHGGVEIDCSLSQEMIETLFKSRGPLHDGAIIVTKGRIKRAGAILPLSERRDIPSHYGTRHRAALGLSEVCDALILVVSEERGEVSLAHGGEIFPVGSKEELKFLLETHLGGVEKEKVNREYVRLAIAGAFCFIVVSGIWFTLTRGQTTFSSYNVPIEFIKRDKDTEIINTSANSVKVTLSGPRVILRSLDVNDINLFIRLREKKPGIYIYDLTAKNLSLPPGLKLIRIDPHRIRVKLDRIVEKTLPVQVDWVGKLRPDILIPWCKVYPSTVMLKGPQSLLSSMSTIYTESVPVDDIEEAGEIVTRISLPSPSLKIIGRGYRATVEYGVTKKVPPKKVSGK